MYIKDKKFDLHIRINARQYAFIKWKSEDYKIKIAELVRMLIDNAENNERKEKNENIKTDINDII